MKVLLRVSCLHYAFGKQPSISLINLGNKWTLRWWWWFDDDDLMMMMIDVIFMLSCYCYISYKICFLNLLVYTIFINLYVFNGIWLECQLAWAIFYRKDFIDNTICWKTIQWFVWSNNCRQWVHILFNIFFHLSASGVKLKSLKECEKWIY